MWKELEILRREYLNLNLSEVLNYEKFAMISIVYNSTKIEGCSLTENDTKVLLENDITAKGKPLSDHLMVKDHFEAFKFIKAESEKKRKLSLEFIQEIAALVMNNTGSEVNTVSGSFNTSEGDFRLAQVYVDKKYFPDFKKIKKLLLKLIKEVNDRIDKVDGVDVLKLSADVHYNLVNIHPFGDGNGRTARLLMNYIQLFHNEPLVKIFTEDRADYIDALNDTEAKGDISIFRDFICMQQIKFFKSEIEKFRGKDKGFNLLF
ncbi:MAG: Fic family protein [Prolixibacteraceae bacterium]|nr:Fic family protein [Prolixibacteraceae bacterium]